MTDDYANWSARGRAPTDDEAALRAALDGDQPRKRDAALALVDAADAGCDDPDCDETGLEDATVAALAETARTADDPDTRQFAVEALGVAGRERETVAAALDDADEWVRAEAVVALSRVAPGATEPLRAALDDDHEAARRNALIALAKTDSAGAETLVDRLKDDPSPAVREYAAQFLPDAAETERAVRLLAAVLARDPGSFVRAKAAEGLGDLGTDRAEQALETHGLEDRSDDVRRTAERALARSRGVDPEELDASAAPGGPEAGVRNGAGPRGDQPGPPGGADADPGRLDDGDGPPAGPASLAEQRGPVQGSPKRGAPGQSELGPTGSHPGPDPRPPGHTDSKHADSAESETDERDSDHG